MEEPFWLGLLAVFVVLGILGAGYTVKKHLPDKFDRLITEDGTKTQSAKTSNASHVGGLPGKNGPSTSEGARRRQTRPKSAFWKG